jgi:RimJ/RimL family protein N-acetyltransferase
MEKVNDRELSIRELNEADIPLLERWLQKEHVKKWYGDPGEWLDEIRDEKGAFSWIRHFIAEYGGLPIGFGQYYDCGRTGPGYAWENEPAGTFGIDYMIGEEEYLGTGLGKRMISMLVMLVKKRENTAEIIADPVPENTLSAIVLEKCGFKLDGKTGLYKLAL